MEKNYNFNYINRKNVKKSDIEFINVESASCTSAILKKSPIANGRLWHTTDTNEFFYDWDGKRTKLNVTGDSASLSAEIDKIKSDVAKLNPEKINQLETKVNNAVSTVNNLKTSVNSAVSSAQAATQAANDAAELANQAASQVTDKVDRSELDDYALKSEIPDVSGLASKSEIPDVSDFASKSDIPDVSGLALKSEIPDVSDFASKSEIPSVDGLASEQWVNNTFASKSEIPDVSGLASKSEIPDVSNFVSKNDLNDYVKSEDLPDYLTDSDLDDYVKKGDIPSLDDYATKTWVEGKGYLTTTNQRFPNGWRTNGTMADLIEDINNDNTAVAGKSYFGTVAISDLPTGLIQAEMKVEVMVEEMLPVFNQETQETEEKIRKVVVFTVTSSGVAPYHWEYTSAWGDEGVWRSFLTEHQSLNGYATETYVDDAIRNAEIGGDEVDLSDYAKKSDLVDFLTASDVDDYVKVDDIKDFITADALNDLASKSDLDGYVKTEDVVDYLTASDLDDYLKVSELPTNVSSFTNDAGYITANDLPEFLTGSDLDEYVKVDDIKDFITADALNDLASKSDLDGYVKTEDAIAYLTEEDLEDYALKSEIPSVPTFKTINGQEITGEGNIEIGGLTPEDRALIESLADLGASDFTPGSFPAGSDVEDEQAEVDGFATVQDVMDYVNALLEKKNWGIGGDGLPYVYITGYRFNDTPTDITVFNPFLLNFEGDTEIEVYAPAEISTYDPETYDILPSIKFTVDVPEGYVIKNAYVWNDDSEEYETIMEDHRALSTNPRYSQRTINGVTYNSYCRGPVNEESANSQEQYKIIITRQ